MCGRIISLSLSLSFSLSLSLSLSPSLSLSLISTSGSDGGRTGEAQCMETTFSDEASRCSNGALVASVTAVSIQEGGSTEPCSAAVSESTMSSSDTPEGTVERDPSLRTTESKMEEIFESQARIQQLVKAQVIQMVQSHWWSFRYRCVRRRYIPLYDTHS